MRAVLWSVGALGACVVAGLSVSWLPGSSTEAGATSRVTVSSTAVMVDGAAVVALHKGQVPEEILFGSLVGDLYDPLLTLHGSADEVSVQVAAGVPTETLMAVVYTARQAGFARIDLVVDGA